MISRSEHTGQQAPTDGGANAPIPIVGIGADAGGLAALQSFFAQLAEHTGMAFVIVLRGSSGSKQALTKRLQSLTPFPVQLLIADTLVEPDHVYLAPRQQPLTLVDNRLQLGEPLPPHTRHTLIDAFLQSLARARGANAIGLLLSGKGNDGLEGLKALQAQGGLTLVQAPQDARYPALPRQALGLALANGVGTAGELAQRLNARERMFNPAQATTAEEETAFAERNDELLNTILTQLHIQTGYDLSYYKRSTILRRIARRLQIHAQATLTGYAAFLRQHPEEVQALFKDCLISVTNFFRDREEFNRLEKEIIPTLMANKTAHDTVRIWAPGCATGEEAYSLAILFQERLVALAEAPRLQIFATDIDEAAIATARRGLYPKSIAKDVSSARLQRFFTEESDGYRVKVELRETVLFAVHNLLKDPPFAKLDLISCRNLLIYFKRDVQSKALDLFHYALNRNGYLFLGTAESIDTADELFSLLDKRHHIFQRRTGVTPQRSAAPSLFASIGGRALGPVSRPPKPPAASIEELYQQWTLRRYAPPRVLVNENYEVTHLFNGADRYLREREGAVTQNILQKVLPEVRLDLRAALYHAVNKGERTDSRLLRVQVNGESCLIQLHVGPIQEPGFPRGYFEVVFEERQEPAEVGLPPSESVAEADNTLTSRLEEELLRTRERLQMMVEEHETSTQDLKIANEELQSINEELKSTTEELETSKEELQSMNEELSTINHELKLKIDELSRANSDLLNLIVSTDVGTLFLDLGMRIKRFTPRVTELFNIIESDVGRPLSHISHKIRPDVHPVRLLELAARVLSTLEQSEELIQSEAERWYIMRMFPYRTVENQVDGVVVTFVEVTALKRAEHEIKQRIQQQTVAELGRQALQGDNPTTLMMAAMERATAVLGMEFAKVLEMQADGETLLYKAGLGWSRLPTAETTILTTDNSQSWYTFHEDHPIVVENIQEEKRFQLSPLLSAHNVASGITVAIPGHTRLYGVFGIYSQTPRRFTSYEVDFLRAIANLLGEAIERKRTETELAQERARLEAVLQYMPAGVIIAEAPSGKLLLGNQQVDRIWRQPYLPADTIDEYREYRGFHADGRPYEPYEWPLARAITTGEIIHNEEIEFLGGDGVRGILTVSAAPIRDATGRITTGVAIFDDITERKHWERNEQFLGELSAQLSYLADPDAIRLTALEALGNYLDTLRCAFHELNYATDQVVVHPDWRRSGVKSMAGTYPLSILGTPGMRELLQAGRSFTVCDTQTDPLTAALAAGYEQAGIRAFVSVSYMREGKCIALLAISSATPRAWRADEVALLETVAARVWPLIEKARVEQQLREREAILSTLGDNLPSGAIYQLVQEADGRAYYNYISNSIEALLGLPAATILQDAASLHTTYQAADLAQLQQRSETSRAQLTRYELEALRRLPNGEARWIYERSQPRRLPNGATAWDGIYLDITARKAAQGVLERYQLLAQQTRDMIFFVRPNGAIIEANQGAVAAYGYAYPTLLTKSMRDLRDPAFLDSLETDLAQANSTGILFETRHRRADGSTFPVEISARGAEIDGERLILSVVRDISERKRVDAALRQSEARYRELANAMPQIVYTTRPDGRADFTNEQWHAYTGISVDNSLAYEWTQSIHPADRAQAVGRWQEAIRMGAPYETEYRLQGKAGEYRWFLSRAVPVRDETGQITKWIGNSIDIHERKQAETVLQQQAQMLESTHDAIFMWELGNGIAYWNRGAELLYGYTKAEALGQVTHTLLHTLHPMPTPAFETLLRSTGEWTGELQHTTKTGQQIIVLSRQQLFQSVDGKEYILETSHDITDRKQAEEALRASAANLRAAIEHASDAIFIATDARVYVEVNAAACELSGYSREELIGKRVEDLTPPPAYQRLDEDRRLLLAGRSQVSEWGLLRKDGVVVPIEVNAKQLPDGRWQAIVRDITERKLFEARERFLADLGETMVHIQDPDELLQTVVTALGEFLAVSRCYFVEIAEHEFNIRVDYHAGAPPITGIYPLVKLSPEHVAAYQTGHTLVSADLLNDPQAAALYGERYRALGLRARVGVPLLRDGRWAAALVVNHHEPRAWSEAEVNLIQIVAERTWLAVENRRLFQETRLLLAQVEAMLDNAPTGMSFYDREKRYVRINQTLAAINHLPVETHIGQRLQDLQAEQAALLEPYIDQVFTTNQGIYNIEMEAEARSGKRQFLVNWYPVKIDSETRFVGSIVLDITERKQAEETIRQQLNEIEAIYAATPVGLCMVDANLRYVRINEALAKLNGYPVAWFIGRTLRETGTDAAANLIEPLYNQVLATGEPILNREIHGATAAEPERERDWLVSYYPLKNDQGEVTGVNAVVVEITERKQNERELQRLNDTLEQRVQERTAELERSTQELLYRNRELDQFAYVASHDLRSPLRAIDHLSTWIVQDAGDSLPPASRDHLGKLRGRVKRLERLLDDLLAYSRADRYQYPVEQVDTQALVEDIIRMVAPPAGFAVTMPATMPVLHTERVALELVLRNLINNALKHHDRQDGQIYITAQEAGDFIEFAITDDGPGIAAEFHERIFQMFQTLKPRDLVEGSGMGLAIVKKVVESRGGKIMVESSAGQGATFRFTWLKT